jgi:sugar O-acyltransferase (sialic acid O-acetyltransferase NeuD family)
MNLVIIGSGGLAREVYDLAKVCYANNEKFKIKGFLTKENTNIEHLNYLDTFTDSENYEIQKNDVFFCAIGNVKRRKLVVERILKRGGKFINLIHPTANISPSVNLGVGVAIKSYCVISSDSIIGDFSYLQSSVIIGHDVTIGKYCQINSFSFFAGNVTINNCVTINAGAKLIQNIKVDDYAKVGMGSVVLNNVKKIQQFLGCQQKY